MPLIIIGILLVFGAYTDWTRREIPNWLTLSIFLSGFFTGTSSLPSRFLGLIGMIIILVLVSKMTGKRSGGGDIKLYLSLVFAIGWFFFSMVLLTTIVFKIVIDRLRHSKSSCERFPLCCYLAPAYLLVMLILWIF